MQSVPITTKVLSLNPIYGELYSIQYYICDKVSYFQHVSGFLQVLGVSSTNKTDRQDITEKLLKVAFIHHKPNLTCAGIYFFPFYLYSKAYLPWAVVCLVSSCITREHNCWRWSTQQRRKWVLFGYLITKCSFQE